MCFLLRPLCWWRGYHTSPGKWGWHVLTGGFDVYCGTCGRAVKLPEDKIVPGKDTQR